MTKFHLYLYGPQCGPIPATFDGAQSRLSRLANLHFEPDGSFAWIRRAGSEEVFGMLYDDMSSQLQYCELRGTCTLTTWRELCAAISGRGDCELQMLLLPERELQDLQSFERRWTQN